MKKQMKKMCILLGCCCMSFGLMACGNDTSSKEINQQNVTENDKDGNTTDGVSFSGKDIEGNEVSSKDLFAGHKLTMVNVWATYCQPCIQELPDLEQLNREMEAEGVQIIGILSDVVDMEGNYSQENWELGKNIVKEKGVTYPTVLCDVSFFQKQIVIDAVPTTFFVDENGKVVGELQIGSVEKEEYKKLAEDALQKVGE